MTINIDIYSLAD